MLFPFTFRFPVPVSMPFSSTPSTASDAISNPNFLHRPHLPSPSPSSPYPIPQPLSRKQQRIRDSVVSSSLTPSDSASAPVTNHYGKRSFHTIAIAEDQQNADNDELPPMKRRRGLAGSIVSTALNAALIGTAVGMTVYRLWRDRNKEHQLAPPPYHVGDWSPPVPTPSTPVVTASHAHALLPVQHSLKDDYSVVTLTPSKSRKIVARPRPVAARRTTRVRPVPIPIPVPAHISETTEIAGANDEDEKDEMDWIGDKLSMLIEEGKRALGREIVVSSETPEDAEDDGLDCWVEDDGESSTKKRMLGGSIKRETSVRRIAAGETTPKRSRARGYSVDCSPAHSRLYTEAPIYGTPSRRGLAVGMGHSRGVSVESAGMISTSFQENASAWESPELRASMEQARARVLARTRGV